MGRVLMYPLWLRSWHWINVGLFLILILTGISLHYSSTSELFIPFSVSIYLHNFCGSLLSANYLIFTVLNIRSGNWKQYIPKIEGFVSRSIKQIRYYIYGVFIGEDHPFHTGIDHKFNPLQQVTYFSIMFFFMPLICISGWLLMFPELAPVDVGGMGGVWPMAVLHSATGFFLSLFMFGHIYLATHGATVGANFKSMIDGYHEHDGPDDPHEAHKFKYPKYL